MAAKARGHGELRAGDVGAIVGVSGTTVGQWARHGFIRASVSEEVPHVYGVEDVGEASIVAQLLARGVRHAEVRRAVSQLVGPWPLGAADLATLNGADRRPLLVLDATFVLGDRGWQRAAIVGELTAVRVRLSAQA